MTRDEAIGALRKLGSKAGRESMLRYGIPNERAFGVAMREMKRVAKDIGTHRELALELWDSGWYEARTVAVFIDDASRVTKSQMDTWAGDFDSWAICDTACFHLFDKTPHAWGKVGQWAKSRREYVRRAAFALIWSLAVHDKAASNRAFTDALKIIEANARDARPLVKKGIDMALRATGKRNLVLNKAAIRTARRLAESDDAAPAWIGRHSLRELESDKLRARLK